MTNTVIFSLHERPFEAIKKGTKNVEVRANKKGNQLGSITLLSPGDEVIFLKEGTQERLKCTLERITLYPTVRELLMAEGCPNTLSSGKNLEDGIISIESIPTYKELIAKNGVFALKLKNPQTL